MKADVLDKERYPVFRDGLSKEVISLMTGLLQKSPGNRLGWKNDFEDIKDHAFFKGVDWIAVANCTYEVAWKPVYKDYLLLDYADEEELLKFEIMEDSEMLGSKLE